MIKRLHQDTPTPCSHPSLPMDNLFIEDKEEEDEDGVIIINDVDELCFEEGDPANDLKMGDTNVSQLFRQYQNESLKIAKTGGLLVSMALKATPRKFSFLNTSLISVDIVLGHGCSVVILISSTKQKTKITLI